MQEAEEPAPESETQRDRGLRFVGECGVVELKLVEGIAQHRVVGTVHGVQAGIDHRSRFAVAGERFCGSTARERHRVADLRLAHVLHTRDQVADLPDSEPAVAFGSGETIPTSSSSWVVPVDIILIFSRGMTLPSTTRT